MRMVRHIRQTCTTHVLGTCTADVHERRRACGGIRGLNDWNRSGAARSCNRGAGRRAKAGAAGGIRAALLDAFASALERPAVREVVLAANAEDMTRAREEERLGHWRRRWSSGWARRGQARGRVEGLRQLARMPELVGQRLTTGARPRAGARAGLCPLGLLGWFSRRGRTRWCRSPVSPGRAATPWS